MDRQTDRWTNAWTQIVEGLEGLSKRERVGLGVEGWGQETDEQMARPGNGSS